MESSVRMPGRTGSETCPVLSQVGGKSITTQPIGVGFEGLAARSVSSRTITYRAVGSVFFRLDEELGNDSL